MRAIRQAAVVAIALTASVSGCGGPGSYPAGPGSSPRATPGQAAVPAGGGGGAGGAAGSSGSYGRPVPPAASVPAPATGAGGTTPPGASPAPAAAPPPTTTTTAAPTPATSGPIAAAATAYATHMSFLGSGMSGPNGLAIDGSDTLYEADYFRGTVTRVTQGGQVSQWCGGLSQPAGLAFQADGTLLVAEYESGRISKIRPGGGGFAPFATGFHHPVWPAVDSHGTIYVADYDNGRIAKVTSDGQVSTFANVPSVNAISIDASDNLWICSWGGTVAKITPQGQSTTLANGLGTADGIAWSPAYLALVLYGGETSRDGKLVLMDFSGNTATVATGLDRSSSCIFDSQGAIYTADCGDTALRKYSKQ